MFAVVEDHRRCLASLACRERPCACPGALHQHARRASDAFRGRIPPAQAHPDRTATMPVVDDQARVPAPVETHLRAHGTGVNPSVETIRLAHLQRSSLLPSFIREKDDRCGGCGKLRFVQFSKSLVGAFCASTGTAASTPSFVARNCPITWHRENRL